ncbi:Uncharacterized protein PCOAH_00005740 [Plasmodium coatneyi]|uniref:C2H2-type domain-containing protein n=1 Tax=Plasmodium coatneyi TaxID=208452 RepID=A0A1B1DU33_9APIC|nr:Uncharacterized protein PCOAH_00005740 [Plasmodium coatneyi]ANQ06290.1 Uncharacterized protein PCOAH_00005740 [Plasmodium coatneyi]
MSYEWLDALQWRGNKSVEFGREEEKRTNCYELINDKIFVYRCNTCLLVFTCVHSFSNHVLNENHQIKQLNSLKKGKYFNCLRCKYVCLSIAKIISHIELYNHCHNILRKIKRNMVYNGIASCSCKVKCYTFYSQNKNCLTTGDPILAEYEGVPNFQPIDEGGMCPYQGDSFQDGDINFFPKTGVIPSKERNLLLMSPSNDLIPRFSSTDIWRDHSGEKSLRRKTLGFILSTTGGAESKVPPNVTDAVHHSPADMNIAPMPCNQVGEQNELNPICTDINKINDFNAVLLNLEKQEKQKKQSVKKEENSCSTDATRNLLLHIYENNYHFNRMSGKDSFHHDNDHNEKRCDILQETEGLLFSSPSGLNNGRTFVEKNYDPFRTYAYNHSEQGSFSLFPKEENAIMGTRTGGHPQSGVNNPDRKDTIGTSKPYNALHEAGPPYVSNGGSTKNNTTQNGPPNYDPIFKDHHILDQFLSTQMANKIDLNMEGEMEEVKSSFLRSIQNSAKKLAALDTLYLYEQQEGASHLCSDQPTMYRSMKETQTSVEDQIDTHPNGTPSGMHSLDEQQMGSSINGDKISPSEEDLKKYFCKNFLPHIFDYQPRSMVPTKGGVERTDSEKPSNGKVDKMMEDTLWDARHDMSMVNGNIIHNMAERKTQNREPFTEMEYPPRGGATDAAPYLTQRIDENGPFLSSTYWQSQMDELNRVPYKHMDGKGRKEDAGGEVEPTNQLSYMKHTIRGGEQSGDPHAASPFSLTDSSLTYINKKKNENVTEEREKKNQLDLLTLYRLQGGRSPYPNGDGKMEGTHADVQNREGNKFHPELNKNSLPFNQPYEDLLQYGKCLRGWAAEEENGKEDNPLNRHDGPLNFTATRGETHRGVVNTNAQNDSPRQAVVTKQMNQLCAPSSSGSNFNMRRLSLPSRHTSVSNPTKNAPSRTKEDILNSIFEDPSDERKNSRTPSETAALNQKRQSFIDEIGEIKKSIEKENKNNRQVNMTHISPPYAQRMAPAIPFHGERSNFPKNGEPKKQSFFLGSRNNDDKGAYPDFKSIRINDSQGEGAHSGIPAQSGHFHNGYFQSGHLDNHLENHLENHLDSRRDHFSRAHQERKKSTDGENGQPFSSNLSKWQSRR